MASDAAIFVPEIDYKNLEFYERLSAGSYGTVYRAKLAPMGQIVAVKKVLVLEKEAQVLSLIRHKNIIRFYGAVTEPPNFCIILEFACNGSLYSYLHNENIDSATGGHSNVHNFGLILRWASDIASGVNYLHNEAPMKILHRDLKSNNIVIDDGNVCKLCDFGTSKALMHTTKMTAVGTVAWMSPEMIQNLPASETTDTWSYGVLLWELLTRQIPFKGFESFRIAWMVVEENERLCVPSGCPNELATFLQKCWSKDPKMRPLFPEILKFLSDLALNQETSQNTELFLTRKNDWLREIEDHISALHTKEHELSEREEKLKNWANLLARREKNIANSRRLSSSHQQHADQHHQPKLTSRDDDVGLWDENDVANWFDKRFSSRDQDFFGQSSFMCSRFRDNRINGSRLRLLTDTDLRHMGLSNAVCRGRLLDELHDLFGSEKTSEENFEKKHGEPCELNLTLLTGFYVRECVSIETHRWKCFLDLDDTVEYESGVGLIKRVTFWSENGTNWRHEVEKAPFIVPEWTTGLNFSEIFCKVEFALDLVLEPQHVLMSINFDFAKRSCLAEKLVQVKIRQIAETKVPRFSRRRMHLPLNGLFSGGEEGSPVKTMQSFNSSIFTDAKRSQQIHVESPIHDLTLNGSSSDSTSRFNSMRKISEGAPKCSSALVDSMTNSTSASNASSRLMTRAASDDSSNQSGAEVTTFRQRPIKNEAAGGQISFFPTGAPFAERSSSTNDQSALFDSASSNQKRFFDCTSQVVPPLASDKHCGGVMMSIVRDEAPPTVSINGVQKSMNAGAGSASARRHPLIGQNRRNFFDDELPPLGSAFGLGRKFGLADRQWR